MKYVFSIHNWLYNFGHKFCIWKAFSFHELRKRVTLIYLYLKSRNHKFHNGKGFHFHELMRCVSSSCVYARIQIHKSDTWKLYHYHYNFPFSSFATLQQPRDTNWNWLEYQISAHQYITQNKVRETPNHYDLFWLLSS